MDLGVYFVNAVVGLLGLPEKVVYEAELLSSGVDINGVLIMKYPEVLATAVIGKNSIAEKFFTVQGDKGTFVTYDNPAVMPDIKFISQKGTENIGLYQEYEAMAYTLSDIKRIIEEKDKESAKARLLQIQNVIKILDEARRYAGIVFKADLKGNME